MIIASEGYAEREAAKQATYRAHEHGDISTLALFEALSLEWWKRERVTSRIDVPLNYYRRHIVRAHRDDPELVDVEVLRKYPPASGKACIAYRSSEFFPRGVPRDLVPPKEKPAGGRA